MIPAGMVERGEREQTADEVSKRDYAMAKPGGDPSSGISLGDALILPKRHPACRRREAQLGSCTERENLSLRCQGRRPSGAHHKDQSTEAEHRGGAVRSRDEGSVMELD